MVTSQNLDDLRAHGHGYIVGRNRRRSGEVFDYIQSATGAWIECPVGITAREKASSPKTLVQEVLSNQPGVRVFVAHSEERLAFERRHRIKAMERVQTRLEKLQQRIARDGSRRLRRSALPPPAFSGAIMATAITAGPTRTASFASSSIRSTLRASRPMRANTSSRPKSPICPPSMRYASTRNFRKSNAASPTSRT